MTTLTQPRARPATLDWPAWARTVGAPGAERWMWWVAGAGWAFLLVESAGADLRALDGGSQMHGSGHADMGSSSWASGLEMTLMWVAMVAATMLPLVAWNVRFAARRSARGRRARTTREVVAGWSLVWAAGSVLLVVGIWSAERVLGAAWTLVLTLALAFGWQLTGTRRLALARCHRTLAPPIGAGAARACLSYGVRLGRDCFVACWPLMAAMGVAGHEVLVMVPLAWLSWRDRRLPPDQPGRATTALVLLGAAVFGLVAI